jgi:hypothetical protein
MGARMGQKPELVRHGDADTNSADVDSQSAHGRWE